MKIVRFVDTLPVEPNPFADIRFFCKNAPDQWAETDYTGMQAGLMHNSIKNGKSVAFPKSQFRSEVRNGRLYIRYIGG